LTIPNRDPGVGHPDESYTLALSTSRAVSFEIEHTRAAVFDLTNQCLASAIDGAPAFIIVDEELWPVYGAAIERYAQTVLDCRRVMCVPGNEATKSLSRVEALCDAAVELHLPRHGVFIAVGGGTILDAVGFAASIYRRGVAYLRIPTTLIGMIDVGVGIKQAINFGRKKNVLGSFYPPLRTINDVRFLNSLPARQLACGIAEAIKVALICDARLFESLEEHAVTLIASGFSQPKDAATDILMRSEIAMMKQLQSDLYESKLKRLVDFGHSFSPVIETSTNYAVAHGEAVALDILLSTAIAARRAMCAPDLISRLARLYAKVGLPTSHPSMSPLLMERALIDARAHRGGALNLVVPTGIGSAAFLQDVNYDEIASALELLDVPR